MLVVNIDQAKLRSLATERKQEDLTGSNSPDPAAVYLTSQLFVLLINLAIFAMHVFSLLLHCAYLWLFTMKREQFMNVYSRHLSNFTGTIFSPFSLSSDVSKVVCIGRQGSAEWASI